MIAKVQSGPSRALTIRSIFFAEVGLPHGATVTEITLNCKDANSEDIEVLLARRDFKEKVDTIASAVSSSSSGAWRSFVDTDGVMKNPLVDNENFAYFIRAKLSGVANTGLKLGLVRITYTVSAP